MAEYPSPPRPTRKPSTQPPPAPKRRGFREEEERKLPPRELKTVYTQLYPTLAGSAPSTQSVPRRIIEAFATLPKRVLGSGSEGSVYELANPYADLGPLTKWIAVKVLNRPPPYELKVWPRISEQCGFARHTLPLLGAWSALKDDEEASSRPQVFLASPPV